jgi:REP element-mobilizing transposase RayT
MLDHLHLITNPRDGRIKEFTGQLKAVSAKAMVRANSRFVLTETDKGRQVWQESFKDVALWSEWMIWQKINYIHAKAVKEMGWYSFDKRR